MAYGILAIHENNENNVLTMLEQHDAIQNFYSRFLTEYHNMFNFLAV